MTAAEQQHAHLLGLELSGVLRQAAGPEGRDPLTGGVGTHAQAEALGPRRGEAEATPGGLDREGVVALGSGSRPAQVPEQRLADLDELGHRALLPVEPEGALADLGDGRGGLGAVHQGDVVHVHGAATLDLRLLGGGGLAQGATLDDDPCAACTGGHAGDEAHVLELGHVADPGAPGHVRGRLTRRVTVAGQELDTDAPDGLAPGAELGRELDAAPDADRDGFAGDARPLAGHQDRPQAVLTAVAGPGTLIEGGGGRLVGAPAGGPGVALEGVARELVAGHLLHRRDPAASLAAAAGQEEGRRPAARDQERQEADQAELGRLLALRDQVRADHVHRLTGVGRRGRGGGRGRRRVEEAGVLEGGVDAPEGDLVPVGRARLGHLAAPQARAVRAAQVAEEQTLLGHEQLRVLARYGAVLELQGVPGAPPDGEARGRDRDGLAFALPILEAQREAILHAGTCLGGRRSERAVVR